MKTSQVLMSLLLLSTAVNLTACSATIKGDAATDPGNGTQSSGFKASEANGQWKTGCFEEAPGFNSSSTLELSDGNFKATTQIYNGGSCTADNLAQSQTSQGRFVVVRESDKEAGSYEVDMEIPAENGVTIIEHDLVRLEDGKLYLGDSSAPFNGAYPSKVNRRKVFQK